MLKIVSKVPASDNNSDAASTLKKILIPIFKAIPDTFSPKF